MPHRSYGWIADLPDQRDLTYSAPRKFAQILPPHVDLTAGCPPIYTQGRIGSCTAQAVAAAVQFVRRRQAEAAPSPSLSPLATPKHPGDGGSHLADFTPSRLFIYWNERFVEHTVPLDNGAQLRTGIKVVNKYGVCPESDWPYDDTPANPNTYVWPRTALPVTRPGKSCFRTALQFQTISYQRVDRSLPEMRGCLASGYPFVFGFVVYESFESAKVTRTGIAPMPKPTEDPRGGHAVLAIGYDNAKGAFLCRNSWGSRWGQNGYFTIPYDYLMDENLSDDFWTIRLVE